MKKLITLITLTSCALTINFNLSAQKIYSCKNASGKMVFQDKPCTKTTEQLSAKTINPKTSSAATINDAICRKSIENVHKYLMPKLVEKLSAKEREKLMLKNIKQCMQQHSEKDYQEILCFGRANSTRAAADCVKGSK
jgi:hypothetical protein